MYLFSIFEIFKSSKNIFLLKSQIICRLPYLRLSFFRLSSKLNFGLNIKISRKPFYCKSFKEFLTLFLDFSIKFVEKKVLLRIST